MNISFSSFSNYTIHFLKENLLSSLTAQQKKTAIIAVAIFGSVLACYLIITRCYFKAVPLQDKEDIDSKDQSEFKSSEEIIKDHDLDTEQPIGSPSPSSKEVEEPIDTEIVRSSTYHAPHLLDFGQVREGIDGGKAPNFKALVTESLSTIDTKKLWAATFASWIHTTESKEEILQFITSICRQIDPFSTPQKKYLTSLQHLYNNSVKLHDSLPGESTAKEVKIYWNENAEKVLLPYFLKNENVNINNLLFAILPGESIDSPFQAPTMDFTRQLQFVDLNKDKIMQDLQCELKRLSQAVLGKDILTEVENEIESLMEWDTPLMQDAQTFTLQNNLRIQLLAMEKEGKKIDFEGMNVDVKNQFLQDLFKSKVATEHEEPIDIF